MLKSTYKELHKAKNKATKDQGKHEMDLITAELTHILLLKYSNNNITAIILKQKLTLTAGQEFYVDTLIANPRTLNRSTNM